MLARSDTRYIRHNAYVPVAHAVLAESVNPIQGAFFSPIPAFARMTTDVRIRRVMEQEAAVAASANAGER